MKRNSNEGNKQNEDKPRNSNEDNKKNKDEPTEDPYAGIPPLKRPRKTVYKSSLSKRIDEKRRRENFIESIQQLAEVVFQNDPSIISGHKSARKSLKSSSSTIVTNNNELIHAAAKALNNLSEKTAEQRETIDRLTKSLAAKKTEFCQLQSSQNNYIQRNNNLSHAITSNIFQVPPYTMISGLKNSLIFDNLTSSQFVSKTNHIQRVKTFEYIPPLKDHTSFSNLGGSYLSSDSSSVSSIAERSAVNGIKENNAKKHKSDDISNEFSKWLQENGKCF